MPSSKRKWKSMEDARKKDGASCKKLVDMFKSARKPGSGSDEVTPNDTTGESRIEQCSSTFTISDDDVVSSCESAVKPDRGSDEVIPTCDTTGKSPTEQCCSTFTISDDDVVSSCEGAEENQAMVCDSAKKKPTVVVNGHPPSVCISNGAEVSLSSSSESTIRGSGAGDPERGQWSNKLDFLISVINYAVGLGNVWRFPYLCYENGGGAFLFPYMICLVLLAGPSFVMEVSIGQYLSLGGIGVWKMVPICKGIGYASLTIVTLYNIYFVVVVAWVLLYFIASFAMRLPWQHCENSWNTPHCSIIELMGHNETAEKVFRNTTVKDSSSVVEFWERRVLGISSGLEVMGGLRWELVLYMVAAWIVIYFIIWKGLHQSGKIIYVTATFPYVILTILLIRGVTLEGAFDGILFFIKPEWSKLAEPKVWIAAGTQVFFTFGIGFGSVINLGSYNKFHHNFYRDSIYICILNPLTSILAGFVIFSVLGYMANLQGSLVGEVVKSGPGLAFLTYPEVVLHLPLSPIWAALFFLMLFVLGINSQFCTVEALVSSIVDEHPQLMHRRKLFSLIMCVVLCLLGLPMVTEGGMYLFKLMDTYAASGISLLFAVFFQTIAISWIYGISRLSKNINTMLGFQPGWYLKIGWTVLVPLMTVSIFLFSILDYKPVMYADYQYPWWGEMLGWLIGLSSMLWIPLYAIYFICTAEGTLKERLRFGITPQLDRNPNREDKAEDVQMEERTKV